MVHSSGGKPAQAVKTASPQFWDFLEYARAAKVALEREGLFQENFGEVADLILTCYCIIYHLINMKFHKERIEWHELSDLMIMCTEEMCYNVDNCRSRGEDRATGFGNPL